MILPKHYYINKHVYKHCVLCVENINKLNEKELEVEAIVYTEKARRRLKKDKFIINESEISDCIEL